MVDEESGYRGVDVPDIAFYLDSVSIKVTDPETSESWYLDLGYEVCATLLELIRTRSISLAVNIALSSAAMAHRGFRNVPDSAHQNITAALSTLETHRQEFTTLNDHMLSYSYHMLRNQAWRRERAAEVASIILGRTINAEAWRKAVNKWAEKKGLPELDLPHGRPLKKNRNYG